MKKRFWPSPGGDALLAPSILSADFSKLGAEVKEVEAIGALWFHVDVMDGAFVPNITVGPLVVEALRPITETFLDCHLMVAKPEQWIPEFAKAGADLITVHAEATRDLPGLIAQIKKLGVKAGVSINPATPVEAIESVLDQIDLVLVMSVNPGFAGQKFIDSALSKIEWLKKHRGSRSYLIEIDGGIKVDNIAQVRAAGADVFVAGSSVFAQKNRKEAFDGLASRLK